MKKTLLIGLIFLMAVISACGSKANNGGETSSSPSGTAGGSASGDASKKQLVIGMFGGYTGPTAFWNTRARQGVELAVKEINANGGVNGQDIKVIFEDTQGNKTQAASTVEKLVKQDKVDIVFGPPVSGETFVAAPKADAAKTPFLGIVPSAKGIPQIGEYVFRVGSLAQYATPMLLEYMVQEKGLKKVAYVESTNNDYSQDQKKIAEKVLGDKGVAMSVVSIQDGDTDFTAQVATINKDNPDAVFMGTYGTEGGLVVNQLRKAGYKGLVLGTDALAETPYFDLGKDAVEGTILWLPWVPDTANAEIKTFVDKFKSAYNVEPEFIAAFGYDAVYLLKEIVEKKGNDREKIKEGLAEVKDHIGIVGNVTFDAASKEFVHPHYIVEIKNKVYVPIIKK